ncbi:hypothetical protein F4861DRAFT_139680 [Xylaria intraflava]|nr:hypothetical protein F4861DRAFT_139680 [Xylaria intraflava]
MTAFRYLFLHSNPSLVLPQFPSYAFAERMQAVLQQELLAWKSRPPSARGPPPPPSLICFTPTPTYTLGRRQTEPLSESEIARLRSPLFVSTPGAAGKWIGTEYRMDGDIINTQKNTAFFLPTVTHAPRGGLTTYHGPGQLVIWPVIDLHSPVHAHLSVRDYACLLEKTTIATLARQWGLEGYTTENPGVWVRSSGSQQPGGDERKIAALGVHLRRHVTSLGVAINYSTPVAGPPETNPWARIVACGLGDRRVTSVCAELGISNGPNQDHVGQELERLAQTWRAEFVKRLKMHEDADDMLRGYDTVQNLRDLSAQIKGRQDFLVKACPISSLET